MSKQETDTKAILKSVEEENEKLKQHIAAQEIKLESVINAKEESLKYESEKLAILINKLEDHNKEQDTKIIKSDSRIDQLKENLTSHSEILEAILKELKEKDKTIEEMTAQLDTLMKERDGGNDAVTQEFDDKIKKVLDEVAIKANSDRLEEIFKTTSDDITNTKTSFDEKVVGIEKIQEETAATLTETKVKIEAIEVAAAESKAENKSTTDIFKVVQEEFKLEMSDFKELQNQREATRVETTNQIKSQVTFDIRFLFLIAFLFR